MFDRVQHAVQQGQLWRAKEILQGNIAARGYDPLLFEQLGLVLQRMGDVVEAGKYLFLSGARKPEYTEAIALFIGRYARKDPLNLYHAFPRVARRNKLEEYPPVVASDLARLGLPAVLRAPGAGSACAISSVGGRVAGAACLAVFLLVVGLVILGAVYAVQLLARLFQA